MNPLRYIDSHAHLYFDKYAEDLDDVLTRAQDAGCIGVINIGIDPDSTDRALGLARRYPNFCYATAGLHPTSSQVPAEALRSFIETIERLGREKSIVAIGEIGFDFYWDDATPEKQEAAFRAQLDLAARLELPVVIHCREAWPQTLSVVEEYSGRVRGVFHCFGGNREELGRAPAVGWFVSFAGNVTFPKAEELREVAAEAPLERILLETDSPFLAAQAVRGKRNEPAYLPHTAQVLAEVLDLTPSELFEAALDNTTQLFGLNS